MPSEDVAATGFAVGGMEVAGALSSDRLDADDLAADLYGNAEVRVFLVNWAAPAERQLLRVGHIGEVAREDGAFRAEVRGPAASLDETRGRTFRPTCDADVGDERCKVDLDHADFRATGTVNITLNGFKLTSSGNRCVTVGNNCTLSFGNIDFGAASTDHILVNGAAFLWGNSDYSISGGSLFHIRGQNGAYVQIQAKTVTLTGTPAFSTAFISISSAVALINGNTYSGAATGKRYDVSLNGVINTGGGGATYFAGNASGTSATGGQYA